MRFVLDGCIIPWRLGRIALQYGWTLQHVKWSVLPTELVNGDQWRSVQLSMSDVNSVPATSGVYAICACPPGRWRCETNSPNDLFGILYTAIYIGESGNLQRRFRQHCQNPKATLRLGRKCYADALEFWFFRLEQENLSAVEAQLIDCLGPPANEVGGSITARVLKPVPA